MTGKRTRKLVRRFYAERYLLVTIISFAFSVSITRFFLELTGYPQIGGSQLHIAHVLWGGLLLFAGSLFPLIYANKRALDLSALLSGIGVGLFIDEVGKFITRSNDYFFPAAAPIIYAFFLLTLLVFILVRRAQPRELRSALYSMLEQFEEILEGDLSRKERDQMLARLQSALENEQDTELSLIAKDMMAYLERQEEHLVPHRFDFLEKYQVKWLELEDKIFDNPDFFKKLAAAWGIWGTITLAHPVIVLLSAQTKIKLSGVWASLLVSDFLTIADLTGSGIFRLLGEALCGVLLLAAVFFAVRQYKRPAISLAMIGLLVLLVIVNVFIFYFDQFSSIFFTIIQFTILMVTIRYNQRA